MTQRNSYTQFGKLLSVHTLLATLAFLPISATAQQQNTYHQGVPMHIQMNQETAEWQRDIYREVKMIDDKNLGLFFCSYGTTLFSRVFDCVISGKVPAFLYYDNSIDVCNDNEKLDVIHLLKDYDIPYTEDKGNTGKIHVDAMDIPNDRISSYYIKESVYYDSANSSFKTQVTAICPVMDGEDEFEEGKVRFPLFWIRYNDIEPYLTDIYVFPNTQNLRAKMPVTDYFVRKLYNGKIYKVFNPQGLTLPQQFDSEEALADRQKQIEHELKEVMKHTYDTFKP